MLGSFHQCAPEISWIACALLCCPCNSPLVGPANVRFLPVVLIYFFFPIRLYQIPTMTSPLTCPLILIHKLSLGSSSGPRQSSVHFSCSHVKGDSACHPHPSLPLLKHRYRSLAELSHHISLMRLQSCDCTQTSNSSCLFPLMHALGYRNFREAPNSADFAEKV